MDTKTIKELISIVEQSGISTFELEEAGYRIKIGKSEIPQSYNFDAATTRQPLTTVALNTASQEVAEATAIEILGENVISPMLGVYYSAPSPESEPFVRVGQRVKKGDVLCIVEAMKLMNEITAERDGEITQILASNGQIVEFGQAIMKIL